MKMKKILSVAAVLAIAASLGVSASAAEPATPVNGEVTITKSYTVSGINATKPNDTLEFEVKSSSFKNGSVTESSAPAVTIAPVTVASAATTADIVVGLPIYTKVGVYTYEIAENRGSVAGVDYRTDSFYLVVTVTNGTGDNFVTYANVYENAEGTIKLDSIVNAYSAGVLTVTENTTGALGDKEKDFEATVTFDIPNETKPKDVIKVTNPDSTVEWSEDGKTATITVNNGDTVTFENVPKGTTYTVAQEKDEDYDEPVITFGDNNRRIDGTETDTVTIENKRDTNVETGINLDNLPYALALAGVAVAGGSIVIRRRRVND